MDFGGILNQIFQPYFYYSIISLVILFVCIKVLTRFCNFMGQRTRSLLYLVPLALPLIVMLIFMPSTAIQTNILQTKTGTTSINTGAINSLPIGGFATSLPQVCMMITVSQVTTLSVTGIICIIGLIAGVFFAVTMIVADDRIARKVLHVISLSSDEYQWLQTKIAELSKKLAIATPKIGIVEDLRPNAFTIGYGRRATVVFSIGLFNVLDEEDIVAVASHELAHLKNRDFFYKVLSYALTAVSFFNPLAYIASSAAQREREMLADQRAIELLEKPSLLGNALAKIYKAIQTLPKESMLVSLSSNFLVTSSVRHRLGILSTHPQLDKRLRNISESRSNWHLSHRNVCLAFFLSLLLVCSAIIVSNAMVNLQTGFISSQVKAPDVKVRGYHVVGTSDIGSSGPFNAHFSGAQNMNPSMIQVSPEVNNETMIFVINNKAPPNAQALPAVGVLLASPQNLTIVPYAH
jgi:heat shock protein HtpX